MCGYAGGKLDKGKYWITATIIVVMIVIITIVILGEIAFNPRPKNKHFEDRETKEEKHYLEQIQKYINTQNDYMNYFAQFSKIKTFAQSEICAEIGRSILKKNGSAVDAGIAMIFCQGVVEPYNSGLGGGFLMLIYIHEYRKVVTLDAREIATSLVTVNMLKKSKRKGWLPVATPGEGLGLWEAHHRYGKLSWEVLLRPSINLAFEGFPFSKTMSKFLNSYKDTITTNSGLLDFFLNPITNKFYKEGENYVNLKLSKLLDTISKKGMMIFYFGKIPDEIEKEGLTFGGVLNKKDFEKYRVKWSTTLTTILKDSKKAPFTVHIPPLPSYAIMIPMILNIVQEYYDEKKLHLELSSSETELFYHKIVESMKSTFAEKKRLEEWFSVSDYVSELFLKNEVLTYLHWSLNTREKLNLTHTNFPDNLILDKLIPHANSINKEIFETNSTNIYGSTNVAVLASNGDAIIACSSLNDPFGSGTVTHGFVLNNNMLSFLNQLDNEIWHNQHDVNISQLLHDNRSATFHSPMMITDGEDVLKLVLSAYGDSRVITSVSLVIMNYFLANETLKEAVGKFRYHHDLTSGVLIYEGPNREVNLEKLIKYGHDVAMINTSQWPWLLVMAYENEDIVTLCDPRRQ